MLISSFARDGRRKEDSLFVEQGCPPDILRLEHKTRPILKQFNMLDSIFYAHVQLQNLLIGTGYDFRTSQLGIFSSRLQCIRPYYDEVTPLRKLHSHNDI
jgi:hypothetical protein